MVIIHHQGNKKYPGCDLLSSGANSEGGGWLLKENVNDDTCTAVQTEYANTNDYASILKFVNLCSSYTCFVFVISTLWLLLYLFIAICFAKSEVGYFQRGIGAWVLRRMINIFLVFFFCFPCWIIPETESPQFGEMKSGNSVLTEPSRCQPAAFKPTAVLSKKNNFMKSPLPKLSDCYPYYCPKHSGLELVTQT